MAKYRKERTSVRTKRRMFELEQLARGDGRSYVDALARLHIQRGLQEALEAERDEIVGRAWHAHHEEGVPLQYRNGYGDPRCLTCGSGTVEIRMPRLREPYESTIVSK